MPELVPNTKLVVPAGLTQVDLAAYLIPIILANLAFSFLTTSAAAFMS